MDSHANQRVNTLTKQRFPKVMKAYLRSIFTTEIRNKLRARKPRFLFRKYSYSQSGEDLIIKFLLEMLHGRRPKKYLDIGANHPFYISNTALFYAEGGSGILIEPDPYLANLLRNKRSRDTVMQSGVHFSGEKKADFYIFDTPTLNTFSSHEMERYVSMGHRLVNKLPVDLVNVNEIFESSGPFDFMSLDVEGLDMAILEMISWDKYRPTCLCVESAAYDVRNEPQKIREIIEFMQSKNYMLYADTFNNSIFVDRAVWLAHWERQRAK